ncbi:hypothetical protein FQA39_LY18539 [Lamprigera yunnana]|nr:hypothetical protein FQA39_LY18539 [Lamprigera yunnana]
MMRYVLVSFLAIAAVAAIPRIRSPRLDGKIVGGRPVQIEDYNYQISLFYYGSHFCGGSILNDHVVLTAAHCTENRPSSAFSVLYGTHDLESGGTLVDASTIVRHPNYNVLYYNDYDVALVYVVHFIEFSSKAQPTVLTSTPQNTTKLRLASVSGWGSLSSGGSSPRLLYAVNVKEYATYSCNAIYGEVITAQMICFASPGKDSCQGDSGGPLVDATNKEQIGIVSWGTDCTDRSFPGVYTNVQTLQSWIEHNGSP